MSRSAATDAWRAYARRGYRRVPGWLERDAVELFATIFGTQLAAGILGPVCEIGAHLGRTFILLQLMTRADERAIAFDLFELQNEATGRERKRRLLNHLVEHGGSRDRVDLVTCDSTTLDSERFIRHCGGRPRLVSIDAGRSAEAVVHDLRLTHEALANGGVVSLTDYFREGWPQVSEGCCRFMLETGGFLPLAIGGNKIFFSNDSDSAARYRDAVARHFGPRAMETMMFGERVLVIRPATLRTRLARTALWRLLRDTALGRRIRDSVTRGR
jgi:hypothetical protein